ncbi:MAG: hypothetical protein ACSHWZ_14635 [Sulfitobacter sp.]
MNFTQLLRMVRWVRHPPSWRRVQLIAAVIAICLVIVAIEWLGFWPEWATSPYQRGPGARP